MSDDGAPWLSDKRWRDNRIRSNARGQLMSMGIGLLVITGVSAVLLVTLLPRLLAGTVEAAAWLAMMFPVVAVGLAIAFVRKLLAWRRVGPVELELDPFPGSIDGQVGGTFWIDTSVAEETPFEVGLDCLYSYIRRSSDNKSTRSERSVWHATGPGMLVTTGSSAAVQFRFDVPPDLPYSEEHLDEREYHLWRVSLKGEAGGVKLDRHYQVPVFASGERSGIAVDTSGADAQRQTDSTTAILARLEDGRYEDTQLARHAKFLPQRNALEVRQGIGRNRVFGGFCLVFAVVPGVIAWQFWQQPADDIIGAFFSASALIPGAVSLLASLAVIYLLFNSLRTRIDRDGVASQRRVLGIKVRDRAVAAGAITGLTLHRSGSTGSGSRRIEHLDLRAMTATGHVTLVEGIDHRPPAEALRRHLGGLLGIATD